MKDLNGNEGDVDVWRKQSYSKEMYYVNASGFLCPLPDKFEAMEDIRQEYLDHFESTHTDKGFRI